MKIGIIAPHIFMQQDILPKVIFSPGELCISLADTLSELGHEVYLYTPGKVATKAENITADLEPFETELASRGYGYLELLRKHPLTFISLSRQVQGELIANAYADANDNKLDIVHVYMNEEDIALQFSNFCSKQLVFTHHDPFNFSTKYRTVMPKYSKLNWLSMSLSQRSEMPDNTNWVGNIYHGLPEKSYQPVDNPVGDYLVYIGRIIEAKGVHLAIAAVKQYNQQNPNKQYKLILAGKHYSGDKDGYWQQRIEPEIDDEQIFYRGFVDSIEEKNLLLANAAGVIVPSVFSEPFGMVTIEAQACATPVIGLATGATPEIIKDQQSGILVEPVYTDNDLADNLTAKAIASAISKIDTIDRSICRQQFVDRFTLERMATEHIAVYKKLIRQ